MGIFAGDPYRTPDLWVSPILDDAKSPPLYLTELQARSFDECKTRASGCADLNKYVTSVLGVWTYRSCRA